MREVWDNLIQFAPADPHGTMSKNLNGRERKLLTKTTNNTRPELFLCQPQV